MPEVNQIVYKHTELAELMIKDQNIHEGIWMIQVTFGFGAANAGPSEDEVNPSAIIPVRSIGIQRAPKMAPLCVDAAVVNPAPKA